MKHIIVETIKDLKEWMKAYDEHPIDYWNYRWDYLRRRLKNMSDMEQELKYLKYRIQKEDESQKEKQKKKEEAWHKGKI